MPKLAGNETIKRHRNVSDYLRHEFSLQVGQGSCVRTH
jgi:hypothetical protein